MNEQKQPTNVIAITEPKVISVVVNPGGIIGYNVIYKGN